MRAERKRTDTSAVAAAVIASYVLCCAVLCPACLAHPWSSFDLSTVLRYLFDTLKEGDSLSVLLLRRIFTYMSGIDGVREARQTDTHAPAAAVPFIPVAALLLLSVMEPTLVTVYALARCSRGVQAWSCLNHVTATVTVYDGMLLWNCSDCRRMCWLVAHDVFL